MLGGVINGVVKKREKMYYFFLAVFIIYLNILIEKAFFPIFTDGAQHYTTLADYINLDISLLFRYTPYQIVGNLLLTFPLGFILPFVQNYDFKGRIICSVLVSISIEFIQLLMIGYLHLIDVTFDINDIILNLIGCLCGNLIFHLFCKIYAHTRDDNCKHIC